jgi:hypothetical protein
MSSRRFLTIVATLAIWGCGGGGSHFRYDVTAYLAPDDWSSLSIAFDPVFHATGRESYKQPYVGRTYELDLTPSKLPRPTITVTVSAGGQTKGSATMVPFMCDGMGDFLTRIAQGSSAVESAEIYIDGTGTVHLEGDFDRPLWHRCDLSAGGAGDGVSAANVSTPELCTEPARQQTSVMVSGGAGGQARAPTFCHANLYRTDGGDLLRIQLISDPSVPGGDDGILVSLAHCVAAGEAYPLRITAPVASACPIGPFEDVGLFVGPAASVQHLHATTGGWSLDAVDLGVDGVIRGSVDATFVDSQNLTYHIAGAIDLPNTMVPGNP